MIPGHEERRLVITLKADTSHDRIDGGSGPRNNQPSVVANDLLHSKRKEGFKGVVLPAPQDPDGDVIEQKVSVVADGYFWLDTGKNYHQFLEIDLRTVTGQYSDPGLKDWARKIRAFSEYYRSGKYQRRYPEAGSSMRVLTVTTGMVMSGNDSRGSAR